MTRSELSSSAIRAYRISASAAAVVIALTAASLVIGSPTACGGLDRRYPVIIAFELARSAADLRALFGDGGACRTAMVTAMDRANWIDLAAFMPAYGLFLAAWFVARRRSGHRAGGLGATLAALAVAADVVENLCLLKLTPQLDATSPWLAILPWATGVKWLALGGAGAAAAWSLWPGGRGARVGAALCAPSLILTVGAVVDPHRFGPVVTAGVAASWLVIAVDAIRRSRARA